MIVICAFQFCSISLGYAVFAAIGKMTLGIKILLEMSNRKSYSLCSLRSSVILVLGALFLICFITVVHFALCSLLLFSRLTSGGYFIDHHDIQVIVLLIVPVLNVNFSTMTASTRV